MSLWLQNVDAYGYVVCSVMELWTDCVQPRPAVKYAAVMTFASQIVETSIEPETSNSEAVTIAEVEPAPGVMQTA